MIAVRDREYKLRRIFIMEKVFGKRFEIPIDQVQSMSVSDITLRISRKTEKGDIDIEMVTVKQSGRLARFKKWFDSKILVKWEDDELREHFLSWRQKPFIANLRQTLCMMAFFDLYSAFINSYSYCNARGKFALSPSLCGDNGLIIRNIRLSLPPILICAVLLSYIKSISESTMASQTIVALIFSACGSSVLFMDMYLYLFAYLIVASIITMLVTKTILMFLFLLLFVSIPVAASFNIDMEKNEHRFFALWEVLCQQGKV
ncbi:hypothetical protein HDU67_009860 [Dinochytrium kinnereticum]|nr:hypothetical protein HDU67_009860 [Dinochytrium kinnereticum]